MCPVSCGSEGDPDVTKTSWGGGGSMAQMSAEAALEDLALDALRAMAKQVLVKSQLSQNVKIVRSHSIAFKGSVTKASRPFRHTHTHTPR